MSKYDPSTARKPVQVTASDDMRAARLEDGRVVVFTGSGPGLKSCTNDCGAEEIDATESWIVARTAGGRAAVCRVVNGNAAFSDAGLSGVTRISCGYQHFLALGADGSVAAIKSVSGAPTYYANALCTAAGTAATAVSAGREADAVVLADNRVWVGDALAANTNLLRRLGPYAGGVDVRAGRTYRFVGRKLPDRTCFSLYGKMANGLYYATDMTEAAYRVEAGSSTNLICLLDNGGNAVMNEFIYNNTYASEWKYGVYSGIGSARDLWWKRDSSLAVTAGGTLLPMAAASASGCKFDFRLAAVTTGTYRRGIAAAVAKTRADLADTDGDGVPDGYEVALGMEPTVHSGVQPDSDTDGLPDWWETLHGLNPQSAADASADPDGDGMTNAREYAAKTDPRNRDTDGDGRSDGGDDDPLVADSDGDGLCDARENAYGTDPDQPDTDGEGLSDGWELRYGMNPLADNRTDADPDNDPEDDPDSDGLTNAQESDWNTDPEKPDSDGDGKTDGREASDGSDPNDSSDTQARGTVTVPFTFGDHSSSHSEKYRLVVSPGSGDPRPAQVRVNHYYGQTETFSLVLVRGARYAVALGHAATDPAYTGSPRPDYDYTLTVSPSGLPVTVDDPEGILGVHNESDTFFAAGKSAALTVPKVDLDGDNEEDGDVDDEEDAEEEKLPVVVAINEDTRELTVRRVGLSSGGILKIKKTGAGKITLKKPGGETVLGENDAASEDILADAGTADLVLTLDGTAVGDVDLELEFVSGTLTCSDLLKVKVVKSDVVIRKGDGVIAWLIGEDATHSGIDWGPLVTDIYNPGIEQITLTEFEKHATDKTKRTRLRLKKELFMARRVWAKVYDNMNGQFYALPSDAKPWNLFTTALDYRTANCNEFVRGQFRKAVADVYAELVSQEQREAFAAAYYDGSAVRLLIGQRHLTLFAGPPSFTLAEVNGMVAAEWAYSQYNGVADSFQHVYEGECVRFYCDLITGDRYQMTGGKTCSICGTYPLLNWRKRLLPNIVPWSEAHHSTITPASLIDSTFFETIPY